MRTTVLNHFHTFHPDAQAEFSRLAAEEKRIQTEIARRGEVDPDEPPKRQRASEPPEDLEGQLTEVRRLLDEQREVIASGVVRIVIKGLSRGEFRRLMVEHPPRDDDALDQQCGYNVDSFGDALIQASIVRTEGQDGAPVDNDWSAWADDMTEGQWEEVFRACLRLTKDGNPVFPR